MDKAKIDPAEAADKIKRLATSHGAIEPGRGLATGVIALVLGILCVLGVQAFPFTWKG